MFASPYLYDLVFYGTVLVALVASADLSARLGWRHRREETQRAELATLSGATLGLLALLLGFSFSLALARYDQRRAMVLEEANAIGSTANFALMLPSPERERALALLRQYATVRVRFAGPSGEAEDVERDIEHSLELQRRLWDQAVAATATAPQSLPTNQFVASLNEVNNIHERRVTALRSYVPATVMATLILVALLAMGITGYHAGLTGSRRHGATLVMALMVGVVILLVVDLDRPAHGLIQVSVQPLLDAERGIPR